MADAASAKDSSVAPVVFDAGPKEPPLSADAGVGFKAKMVIKITTPAARNPHFVRFDVNGDRVRYPSPNLVFGRPSQTIADLAARRLILLPDGTDTFVRVDLPAAQDGGDAPPFPLVKTGKKDKVLTIPCEVWEARGKGKARSAACIAEGIAFVDFGHMTNIQVHTPAWMRAMSFGKRFPVRAVEIDQEGKETLVAQVSVVSEAEVKDSDFVVPASVKERSERLPGSPFKPGLPN